MFLKKKGITVNSSDIRKILDINDKTFKEGLKKIYPLYPEFKKRDKISMIKNKIIEINNHFKFEDEFLTNSDKILRVFGPYIQNTTELSQQKQEAIQKALTIILKLHFNGQKIICTG